MKSGPERYQEFIDCAADTDACLVFIKVFTLPHLDPVEFNVAEARAFAAQILSAVEKVEKQMEAWDTPKP